jgi:hypothetical protein
MNHHGIFSSVQKKKKKKDMKGLAQHAHASMVVGEVQGAWRWNLRDWFFFFIIILNGVRKCNNIF